MTDIVYVVKIDKKVAGGTHLGYMFDTTTCSELFCGRLVNQENGKFYFELNGSEALIIIPHRWIQWMAPSKNHWHINKEKGND